MAHITIDPTISEILSRCSTSGNVLKPPTGQLDRKIYQRLAQTLENAGGKWNKRDQGFVFRGEAAQAISPLMETGVSRDHKKDRQAFYTPEEVANEVARIADVDGHLVLEPSAGNGALVCACLAYGARAVEAIEIHEECRQELIGRDRMVMIADFLEQKPEPRFHRIVMNPPFAKGQDLKHITHAKKFLAPGGFLFAIVPDNENPKLSSLGATTVHRFESGAFKSSGTTIATRLICIAA